MAVKTFPAFVVTETDEQQFQREIKERTLEDLPEGEVLVRVRYSSLNYKDVLSAIGNKGVTKQYPHTPGIDASGVVAESTDDLDFILWDLVFGSWFLPKQRQVTELGLYNTYYPMHFIEQLKTPFTAGIDKKNIEPLNFHAFVSNVKIQLGIWLSKFCYMRPLLRVLNQPMKE
ncbi:MAG: hypothetical protein P8X49_12725, partial [Syntrophobacterales bacterium]